MKASATPDAFYWQENSTDGIENKAQFKNIVYHNQPEGGKMEGVCRGWGWGLRGEKQESQIIKWEQTMLNTFQRDSTKNTLLFETLFYSCLRVQVSCSLKGNV